MAIKYDKNDVIQDVYNSYSRRMPQSESYGIDTNAEPNIMQISTEILEWIQYYDCNHRVSGNATDEYSRWPYSPACKYSKL